ncbi:MAG: hypothetical protein KJ787_14130 [Gammaproteobacteria bacterium]|nr:hypothetical protein [Gammaproteobacteria bacterium]MBU1647466.1 hypothetical protein [Gammaproteobacteria bacterium]MBU1972915.1 hypothetical protein [Gammaproteobacteria bacterium]
MLSPVTCQTAKSVDPELEAQIEAQKGAIAELEHELWAGGLNEDMLDTYQGGFRRLERLIEARGGDKRHKFVIVVPVADRPQQMRDCLDSLLDLCRAFDYGGRCDGVYRKVAVVIADDSSDEESIASNRELATHFTGLGLATRHFGPDDQFALVESLGDAGRDALSTIVGRARREAFGHKGQAVMRNIAYLELAQVQNEDGDERVLFYSIDSDQEFKVKVGTPDGDLEVCAVNFFHWLDEIFSRSDALVLTGKVVGDPPVSPAVMAGNFLEDVIGFLRQMADSGGHAECRHHEMAEHPEGEAAYHDMADLFGFKPAAEAYRYRCPLEGDHGDADCFDHFGGRLNSFFFGEHPTRISYYQHRAMLRTVQPARTVYAGNYVFRPEALKYFIPFAALRLRMSGPVLGRLVKADIGGRFVSANLPMLHKRTVATTGQSEFRPGIRAESEAIELCGEAERQFFGDVMLFTIERLTTMGYPQGSLPQATLAATLTAVHAEMLEKYGRKRRDIVEKIGRLESLLHDPVNWWNRSAEHVAAVARFESFLDNIAHNFGEDSPCYERIESPANWEKWRADLLQALVAYPEDAAAWGHALAGRG